MRASAAAHTVNAVILAVFLGKIGRGFMDRGFIKDVFQMTVSAVLMTGLVLALKSVLSYMCAGKAGMAAMLL